MSDLNRLREAARLAARLSNSGVYIGLILQEDGVVVRGCYGARCVSHVVPYVDIQYARHAVLEHKVVETCDQLTHEDLRAADWRT